MIALRIRPNIMDNASKIVANTELKHSNSKFGKVADHGRHLENPFGASPATRKYYDF